MILEKRRPEKTYHKPFKVLIIDDDVFSITRLGFILNALGVEFEFVLSGVEATEDFNIEKVDAIFLDWNMPQLNGGETIIQLQKNLKMPEQYKKLPYILYTGLDTDQLNLPESSNFYCAGHIDKDCDPVTLTKMVNRLF